jgi:hypothetical protein
MRHRELLSAYVYDSDFVAGRHGVKREWTFVRPKNQPREKQCQGLPHKGEQVKQIF